jgi:choline dehydrogenase-like flavoprotein
MQADVVIVGGGPSGLTLASELAIAGVRTVVLERRSGVIESRAGTILPRVLELFDARGAADRLIRKTREIYDFPFRDNHIYAGLKRVDWRHLNSRFGFTLMIPQNATEQILLEWASEKGADIRHGMLAEDIRRVAVGPADSHRRVAAGAKFPAARSARVWRLRQDCSGAAACQSPQSSSCSNVAGVSRFGSAAGTARRLRCVGHLRPSRPEAGLGATIALASTSSRRPPLN